MLRAALVGVIRLYQVGISPWTPAACRYTPTCSQYALDALELHGAAKGSWLALRRLLRCHPWGGHGYDPVPLPADAPSEGVAAPTGKEVMGDTSTPNGQATRRVNGG